MAKSKKVLILTYYWPPSGGSGVQRWMYFAKYLKKLGWEPIVLTVDDQFASYPVIDQTLEEQVKGIRVIKTATREPLRWYSKLFSGSSTNEIPQGEVNTKGLTRKIAAFIRGNFFIPDARKGWMPFATKVASDLLQKETIHHLITTGPPHSTHLTGQALKKKFQLNWWADFRDPWSTIFYNQDLYRLARSIKKDKAFEKNIVQNADGILTTVSGAFHEELKVIAPNQRFIAIPNGYDEELINSSERVPLEDVFHVVYTGLLTHNQDYKPVLEILSKLSKKHKIRFSLAGNIRKEIIDEIREKLPEVHMIYLGYITHKKAVDLTKSAHLLLNFIFRGAETQMISGKLLEYLATGTPVLSFGDPTSPLANFIKQGSHADLLDKSDNKGIQSFIESVIETTPQNNFPNIQKWSRKELTKDLVKSVLHS